MQIPPLVAKATGGGICTFHTMEAKRLGIIPFATGRRVSFKSVSGLRVRVRIVVDVTVEWGFQALAELFVALASAIALTLTMSKEFAMSVFKNIVCVGAALMPAWWKAPLHK